MIWILVALICLIVFSRDLLFGILLTLKQARPSEEERDLFDFLLAKGRKPFRIFLCKRLQAFSLSWRCFSGKILFVEEAWWNSLSRPDKECLLLWYSLAQEKFLFWQRFFGLFMPRQVDRDCLIEGAPATSLIHVLESISQDTSRNASSILESLLLGHSLFGGYQRHSFGTLELRIQEIIQRQKELQDLS